MTDAQRLAQMSGLNTEIIPDTNWTFNPKPSVKSNILQKLRGQQPEWLSNEKYDDVKRYIMNMLGSPAVKVELTDEQLRTAIEQAKDIFIRYLGRERYSYTIAKAYQGEYDWPDDCVAIYQVYFRPATLSALGNINQALFSDFYLLATDLAVDIYESPVTYWCYMASREMLEKTYGVWGSWENIDYRRFRIYPTPFKDQVIGILYKSSELDISEDRYFLLRKLALAYCKIMLGRIRSKYANIPGSNNSMLTLDGATLLAEGNQDEKDIINYILSLVPLRIEVF
jgi:hypothetical protein